VRSTSRRGLLAGAGALALGTAATAIGVETGVLPGRSVAYHRLGLDGRDGKVPDVEPGRGLDTARIGFLGWLAMSPALWQKYDDTSPGSFDDEADFEDVTPFGHQAELDGMAIRIDCGDGDHDIGYWRRIVPQHLALLGTSLGRPAT
jgi:hypothetical protein